MIHSISSSDPRFKTLSFGPGLNILLADRHEQALDTDTRNGAGKSSLIALIHFLLGGNVAKKSIFTDPALVDSTFAVDLDLAGVRVLAERSGRKHAATIVHLLSLAGDKPSPAGTTEILRQRDWIAMLQRSWFPDDGSDGPSVRSLLSYFVRRVEDSGFQNPFKNNYLQTPNDYQVAVSYLLDLDWRLADSWEEVRRQEKTVSALASALKEGRLGSYNLGSVAKLRTEVTLAEARVQSLRASINNFTLIESFSELEREANALSAASRRLGDQNEIDLNLIEQLRATYEDETPPNAEDLTAMYAAAGVQLGNLVRRRFEEVAEFHESIVQNRSRHLSEEILGAERRVLERKDEQKRSDSRRAEILRILHSGGALSELMGLQSELARHETRLEELRASFRIADQLAVGKSGAKRARQDLLVHLQEDQREREGQLASIIARFEAFSAALYDERVGSLEIGASDNGPTFSITIEAGKSKGINNMQVFCFDLLVSEICANRGVGPRFLVHDSHLFDGVDERQIGRGLALADEIATTAGFQYIVTMNSDDMPTTLPDGFVVEDHVLDVRLTDSVEDGGLFGVRF